MAFDISTRPRCDHTSAWAELQNHFDKAGHSFDLREAFRSDPQRLETFSQEAPHVFADLSKSLIDARAQAC